MCRHMKKVNNAENVFEYCKLSVLTLVLQLWDGSMIEMKFKMKQ